MGPAPWLLLLAAPLLHLEPPVGLAADELSALESAAKSGVASEGAPTLVYADHCDRGCVLQMAARSGAERVWAIRAVAAVTRIRVSLTELRPSSDTPVELEPFDLVRAERGDWANRFARAYASRPSLVADTPMPPERVLGWALVAGSVTVLASGGVLGIAASRSGDDVPSAASAAELDELRGRANFQGTLANVLLGAGLGAALTGVACLLWSDP